VIYTIDPIYTTQLAETVAQQTQLSDEITWQNEQWKILEVHNFSDFGYYKAIATRKLGA
jgi:hypothetical protein